MQDEAVTDAQSLQSGVASEAMDEQMAVIQASITPAVERMLQVDSRTACIPRFSCPVRVCLHLWLVQSKLLLSKQLLQAACQDRLCLSF